MSSHIDRFEKISSYVDSSKFRIQKEEIIKILSETDCPSDVRIIICNWFFRTVFRLYKPTSEDLKKIFPHAKSAHFRAKNIIAKGTYLNYLDQTTTTKLAKYFYKKRFGGDKYFVLQLSNDVTLAKNIFNDPKFTDEKLIKHFIKWIKSTPIDTQQANLLDVLLLNYKNDHRVQDIFKNLSFDSEYDKGLYGNKQSAHDEEVSASALVAAENVMLWYSKNRVPDEIINELYKGNWSSWVTTHLMKTKMFKSQEDQKTLKAIEVRMAIDHTTFGNKLRPFTILDFVVATLKYVFDLKDPSGLYSTIYEEFTEMRELCSSGYIERCVTILQGFNDEFDIKISEQKRLFSAISSKLAPIMSKAPEDVQLGSCDPGNSKQYLLYLESRVNEILPTIQHFGKSLDLYLADTMDEYSSVKGWVYENSKLIKPS
jgi:hypothetical protein